MSYVSDSSEKKKSAAQTSRIAAPAHAEWGARRRPSLLVVKGTAADLGRHVPCEEAVTIGRDPNVELPLHDGSISREHCRVEPDPRLGGCVLVDLGSTNGTSLNRSRVRKPVALEAGDKIFLGVSVIKFAYVDAIELDYHARLEDMAATDPVTGLTSRQRYEALFDVASQEAADASRPLAVMVMDVDNLKPINDTYGHEMGAFVIAETAHIIRAHIENRGVLSRFGGDEIVGCFPEMGKDAAARLAESVRATVEDSILTREGIEIRPTISIGVAAYPDDASDPRSLFEVADSALYRAKRLGKNRVAPAASADRVPGDDEPNR